jgi:hypothetical protein
MSKTFTTRNLNSTNRSFSQLTATAVYIKEDQPHA